MDTDKIKALIASISENLHDCGVGELLFMHHVSLETLDLLSEFSDDEVYKYCLAMEQSIYNEINRRIDNGEFDLSDPQDLYGKLKQYYADAENSKFGEEIKASFLNMRKKKGKKSAVSDFQDRLAKQGADFFARYKKEMGIREPKLKRKIPSPSDIINGKNTDPDIPNN